MPSAAGRLSTGKERQRLRSGTGYSERRCRCLLKASNDTHIAGRHKSQAAGCPDVMGITHGKDRAMATHRSRATGWAAHACRRRSAGADQSRRSPPPASCLETRRICSQIAPRLMRAAGRQHGLNQQRQQQQGSGYSCHSAVNRPLRPQPLQFISRHICVEKSEERCETSCKLRRTCFEERQPRTASTCRGGGATARHRRRPRRR